MNSSVRELQDDHQESQDGGLLPGEGRQRRPRPTGTAPRRPPRGPSGCRQSGACRGTRCWADPPPPSGTAAAAMAQCGCPLPLRTPTVPAAADGGDVPGGMEPRRPAPGPAQQCDVPPPPALPGAAANQPPKPTKMENAADPRRSEGRVPGDGGGNGGARAQGQDPEEGPAGFRAILSVNSEPTAGERGLNDHQGPRMKLVDREEDADCLRRPTRRKPPGLGGGAAADAARCGRTCRSARRKRRRPTSSGRPAARSARDGTATLIATAKPTRGPCWPGPGCAANGCGAAGTHNRLFRFLGLVVLPDPGSRVRCPGADAARTRLRPARCVPPMGNHQAGLNGRGFSYSSLD